MTPYPLHRLCSGTDAKPLRLTECLTEFAALSALADEMTAQELLTEIEARLQALGLAGQQAQGLKLTVEGLARIRAGIWRSDRAFVPGTSRHIPDETV